MTARSGAGAPSTGSRVHRSAPLPDDAAPLYTVSQVADMLGVQAAFVRRLDTEGVVIPARSAGGQRRYSRTEVDHIATVAGLMGEGMTLAGAQRVIELENEIADLRQQLRQQRGEQPGRQPGRQRGEPAPHGGVAPAVPRPAGGRRRSAPPGRRAGGAGAHRATAQGAPPPG